MNKLDSKQNISTELGRELGFISVLAIGVGTMIAAGIFTLSGLAIRNVGSGAIVSFVAAAIVSLFTALTYCEFVSIYPRSGEGYLYARKTFSAPAAFVVGWALFLGYASSCAFYISSLSSYFFEFILELPIESLSGVIFLIALTLLNIKGTKESGGFQVIVTGLKVVLLVWFIVGGLSHVNIPEMVERFNNDIVALAQTSALVFITFFGFSAIAASAGEVRSPVKNIPKAIFWSVGLVTVLYCFVVLVIIASNLSEYTEAAMGIAAKMFLGSIGGMVIVAGAIFSMISASNASIMAGSRVALAMSQLGHLPREIGLINRRTRTPIMALFLVSGLILLFAIALPLESLAHFANTVLLIALIMVNFALIIHRRKYPDIERPFRVAFVPLLPILGILANAYLLLQIFEHWQPLLFASGSLVLGFAGFIAWKGAQPEAEAIPGVKSKVALDSFVLDKKDKRPRILVPVANPANVPALISAAANIALDRNGVLVVLKVITIPEQMPLDYDYSVLKQERWILDMAQEEAEKHGVPMSGVLRIGHHTAKAILETARARNCKLIILGWKGYSTTRDKILGRVTDAVVTHARSDLMLLKLKDKRPIKDVLLPSAGGEHAQAAELYAASLVKSIGGTLTVCRVLDKTADSVESLTDAQQSLDQAKTRIDTFNGLDVATKIIDSKSVVKGILNEAKSYDTLVIGATRDSIYQRILFGSIPEVVAKAAKTNVIMVKKYQPVKALFGRVLSEEA